VEFQLPATGELYARGIGHKVALDTEVKLTGLTEGDPIFPTLGKLYETLDDSKIYNYKGTNAGDETDFEEYDPDDEYNFQFLTTYTIGIDQEAKEVTGIDTKNI